MSKQGKSNKGLIVGIIAAVVVLAAVLVLILTQCSGQQTQAAPTSQTTLPVDELEGVGLYWNVDRAQYDGKSEAGMSSRPMGKDGYFHIRLFKDGEFVELLSTERKIVNQIEVNDIVGIKADENGIITDVYSLNDLPYERVAWKFYVQSVGGNVIKANSSDRFNGMEVLLKVEGDTKVYDMTGTVDAMGSETQASINDRIMAVSDLDGNLMDIYIYDRSNRVVKFDAECQHCGQVVTWQEWKNEKALPTDGAQQTHYKLVTDIKLTGQQSMKADSKLCIDLNGHRVDGADGKRMYSVHNLNCEVAFMDTSEGQTGVLAGHGVSNAQGVVLFVRYGAVYFYGGTIDASDVTVIHANGGAAVYVAAQRFFYMNGGEIIGGTAVHQYNAETKKYSAGMGATIYNRGKFVLNDGVIRDGYAKSVKTVSNGKVTYQRGIGGNYFGTSGSILEINGGIIKNGKAGTGGNIFLDGTAELVMNGGTISGGRTTDPGRNGGNIYVGAKASMILNRGRIEYGSTKNLGGNIYSLGTFTMTGGGITGGKQLNAEGKAKEGASAANVYVSNGSFKMYGGKVDGSVTVTDTTADGKRATMGLGQNSWIDGSHMGLPGLTVSNGKEQVRVVVDRLSNAANIRISAAGVFSEKTDEANLDNFHSEVEGIDVVYIDGCLAMGKLACLCGSSDHFGKCDGTELLWGPWTNESALPGSDGNYILMTDVDTATQLTVGANAGQKVNLDLNGHTISGAIRTAQVKATLSVVDHTGGGQIIGRGPSNNKDHSGVFQVFSGGLDLYAGTLKLADDHYAMSNGGIMSAAAGAEINVYGGTIDARNAGTAAIGEGGAVRLSGVMNIYGGNIYGTDTTNNGGAICVWKGGELNVYGGTVTGAKTGAGGTIYLKSGAKANIRGGVITGGTADKNQGNDAEKGKGGNIMAAEGAELRIYGGTVKNGTSSSNGGNVAVVEKATFSMSGGTITGGVTSGKADNGNANLYVRNNSFSLSGGKITGYVSLIVTKADYKNVTANLSGAPVLSEGKTNLRLYAAAAANQPKVKIEGTLTGEAGSIGITMQHKPGVFATNTTEPNAAIFFSDDANYGVVSDGTTLRMETPKCLCGADTGAKDNGITHKAWCDGTMLNWKTWNGTSALTEGNWYLTGDVTASAVTAEGKVNLDLAGKKLSGELTVTGDVKLVDNTTGGQLAAAVTSTGKLGVFGVNATGAIAVNGGEFTVGGDAKLADVTLAAGLKIAVLGLGENAEVTLTMAEPGVFAEGITTDISASFKAKSAEYEILYKETEQQLVYAKKAAHSHCWCINADVIPEGHVCEDDQVWTPIEKSGSSFTAEDGKYYYMNWSMDDKAAKSIKIPDNATVHLCINGAHIRASNVIQLGTNSKLIICDCKDSGIITTTQNSPIVVKAGQEVTFMSGTIAGTFGTTASRVSVRVEGGSFSQYGGSVERGCEKHADVTNTAKKEAEGTIGGNIRIESGAANLLGGSVTQGELLDGTARDVTVLGGTLTVGGKAEIGVLYLPEGKTVTVIEKDLETKIGISMEKPGEAITATNNMDVAAGFTSLHTDYPVFGIANGSLVLSAPLVEGGHYHCFCQNAEFVPEDHKCTTIQQWTAINKQAKLQTTLNDGDHAYLNWSGASAQSIVVADGATAYLCLNGATIYATQAVTVGNNATLYICDCSAGQTGIITRSGAATTAPINLSSGVKTVNLFSGKISGTHDGKSIISVNLGGGTPTFNMYGGAITGGSNTNHGGNVSLGGANAKFNMFGGTITGGEVASGKHGGNVFMSKGQFVMNGGTITGGKATGGKGGNVMLLPNGATATFTMNGGVIENGSAANGGNIALNALGTNGSATFNMNGGTVKGGTVTTAGENLFLHSNKDSVTVNAGSIIGGTVANAGGGSITVGAGATVDGLN